MYKEDEQLLQEQFSKTRIFIGSGRLHAFFSIPDRLKQGYNRSMVNIRKNMYQYIHVQYKTGHPAKYFDKIVLVYCYRKNTVRTEKNKKMNNKYVFK